MKILYNSVNDERIVLAIQGELNTLAAEEFALAMEPIMEEADKEIILDFSELEYISSAALRTLLQINKAAQQKGGRLIVENITENIKQIFILTGFDTLLEIR